MQLVNCNQHVQDKRKKVILGIIKSEHFSTFTIKIISAFYTYLMYSVMMKNRRFQIVHNITIMFKKRILLLSSDFSCLIHISLNLMFIFQTINSARSGQNLKYHVVKIQKIKTLRQLFSFFNLKGVLSFLSLLL